jgi:hypothetical protein
MFLTLRASKITSYGGVGTYIQKNILKPIFINPYSCDTLKVIVDKKYIIIYAGLILLFHTVTAPSASPEIAIRFSLLRTYLLRQFPLPVAPVLFKCSIFPAFRFGQLQLPKPVLLVEHQPNITEFTWVPAEILISILDIISIDEER